VTATSWTDVLDSFEAELDVLAASSLPDLDGARQFNPPIELGALPSNLVSRAMHIAQRLDDAAALVERAMSDTRRSATVANELSGRTPRPASSVDLSA
jgi:hypothetical protein